MADRRTEERTEISYALITNTDNKVEEKSFMKKLTKLTENRESVPR